MRKLPFFLFSFIFTALSVIGLCVFYPNRKPPETEKKVYLELWHIDTFEGGTGSRRAFLQKQAQLFQKITNIVVAVKAQTPYSLEQNYKNSIFPDMISFGSGIKLPYDRIISLKNGKSGNNKGEYSKVRGVGGGNEYAIPWCMGGYVKIVRKGVTPSGLIIAEQSYSIPQLAVCLSGEKLPIKKIIQSDKAIYEFYADKTAALVGTQRDLFRLQNKGIDIDVYPYSEYNDLYQYVSVIATDNKKIEKSKLFIDYLVSQTVQDRLYEIGMLHADENTKVCAISPPLDVFGNFDLCYALPAFTDSEGINKLKQMLDDYESNSQSIKNALKYLK